MSSHRLGIESGRRARLNALPLEKETYICSKMLEDEFHLVFECPFYKERRV